MFVKGRISVLLAVLVVAILVIPSGTVQSSDADPSYTLEISAEYGTVMDMSTGRPFISGSVVSDKVELLFIANSGHEFVKWDVDGECIHSVNGCTISISELKGNVKATAVSRNYSTSQELITVVDSYGTPVPGDTLVNSWAFASTGLNRDSGKMMWDGMPCTPLIVGDAVYVRADGILYKLDINTGNILKNVISNGTISYYHYISYGNGVIFDTVGSKAYDLDLNYLYDIPSNLKYASYHDGYFYGCLSVPDKSAYYTMFKTSPEIDRDLRNGTKINLFKDTTEYRVFAQYGQFSNVMFENGYFFFLQADLITGSSGWRAMTAINLKTEVGTTIELTGFKGMPWDDGWLSYYNGYFYLTAYTAGLFDGVITGLEDKRSSVMWVKFDFENGTFGTQNYEFIKTAEGNTFRGIASGLEIYEGRGYINVRALGSDTTGGSDDTGTSMISFDIGEDGRPIPREKASSPMTHGGIVINTAYASEGKRYIYLLPYNAGTQGLYVFTDELIDGKWVLNSKYSFMKFDGSMNEYCSQAVRMGPSGELVFYLDSGYIQCYKAASQYQMTVTTINDGFATVQKGYGGSIDEVLKGFYPSSTINDGQLIIGSKIYDIYGLDSRTWSYDKLTDPVNVSKYSGIDTMASISTHYSCYALVEVGVDAHFSSKGESGWYYIDGGEVKKCNIRSRDVITGLSGYLLTYSNTKPEVDPNVDSLLTKPYQMVARGATLEFKLPVMFKSTYAVSDDTIISVVDGGNILTVFAEKEDTAVLTISVSNGQTYIITIDVTPMVYVDTDGNTITESETSKTASDGIRTDSVSRTVSNKDGSTSDSTVKVYGSDGELQYTETVEKTVNNEGLSEFYPDKTGKTESVETIRFDASGTKISHTIYGKEAITQGNQDATTTTYNIDWIYDMIANVVTVTANETVNAFEYTFTKTTTSVSEDGADLSVRETVQSAVSSDGKIFAEPKNEGVSIVIRDGGSLGYTSLKNMVSQFGESVYYVTAEGTVNNSLFDDIANLDSGLTLGDGNGSTIILDSTAMSNLKGKGDTVFSVTDATTLTDKQKTAAGNAKVLDISLKCGDAVQSEFGRITITAVCGIEIQEGKELKVWHIDDFGNKTLVGNASYADGKVIFETDHLSLYAVGYESDENASDEYSIVLVAIGVVVVLALLGATLFLRKKKQ